MFGIYAIQNLGLQYGGCPIFFLPKTTLSPPFRGPFAGFRPQHFLEMRNKPYPILFACPVFDRFVECLEVLLGSYMVTGPKQLCT